ncbi:MAG: nucleotidyltransferase family protein [Pseudomonadota bacterium]
MSQIHAARDTLLALSAGNADPCHIASLTQEDWQWVCDRAEDYRLQPLLHAILDVQPDWPVPGSVRQTCLDAHRHSVFRSLIIQHALVDIGRLFDHANIPYVALKGASLSLEFYDEPALRPMRDLDILVAPHQAESAYDLLKANGYTKYPGKADYGMEFAHHLPILLSPKGVPIELHHRIAPRDWSGSLVLGEQLLANARKVTFQSHEVRMAHPTDTLIHLVVHACLQHLFDNGPNLLSDIRALEQSGLVDWDRVESFTGEYGLGQSLALIKALKAKVMGEQLADDSKVPNDVLDHAASLMTQDPEEHWQRHLLRRRRSLWQRMVEGIGRALKPTDGDLRKIAKRDVKGLAALRYYPQWLWSRGRVYIGAEFRRDLDQQAATDAQLETWLRRPSFSDCD